MALYAKNPAKGGLAKWMMIMVMVVVGTGWWAVLVNIGPDKYVKNYFPTIHSHYSGCI